MPRRTLFIGSILSLSVVVGGWLLLPSPQLASQYFTPQFACACGHTTILEFSEGNVRLHNLGHGHYFECGTFETKGSQTIWHLPEYGKDLVLVPERFCLRVVDPDTGKIRRFRRSVRILAQLTSHRTEQTMKSFLKNSFLQDFRKPKYPVEWMEDSAWLLGEGSLWFFEKIHLSPTSPWFWSLFDRIRSEEMRVAQKIIHNFSYPVCFWLFGFVLIWYLHLVPLIVIAGPVWFFNRKRVRWCVWDYGLLVVPFVVWALFFRIDIDSKAGANAIEGMLVGCFAVLPFGIRAWLGDRFDQKKLALALLILVCLIGAGICFATPVLQDWNPGSN
jgi:hypothetical protein